MTASSDSTRADAPCPSTLSTCALRAWTSARSGTMSYAAFPPDAVSPPDGALPPSPAGCWASSSQRAAHSVRASRACPGSFALVSVEPRPYSTLPSIALAARSAWCRSIRSYISRRASCCNGTPSAGRPVSISSWASVNSSPTRRLSPASASSSASPASSASRVGAGPGCAPPAEAPDFGRRRHLIRPSQPGPERVIPCQSPCKQGELPRAQRSVPRKFDGASRTGANPSESCRPSHTSKAAPCASY